MFIILYVVLFAQHKLPNDWELKELKGKVKRIIDNEKYNDTLSPLKKISNFDENGFLKTVSEYNDYYVEDDSVSLSHILFYKNDSDKRYFSKYDIEKKDTVASGFYQSVKKGEYQIKSKRTDGYSTEMYLYMSDKSITMHTYIVYDPDNEKLADLTMTYNYKDDDLSEINVTENISNNESILSVELIKDTVGNIINLIYFKEDGQIFYELKRKIYYYD